MFTKDNWDPEKNKFKYPDFGFVDNLNADPDDSNLWRMLFFQVSCNPKYERLHNLIQQKSNEKFENLTLLSKIEEQQNHKRKNRKIRDRGFSSLDSNENTFDR